MTGSLQEWKRADMELISSEPWAVLSILNVPRLYV
jgi:hypothetical protein